MTLLARNLRFTNDDIHDRLGYHLKSPLQKVDENPSPKVSAVLEIAEPYDLDNADYRGDEG
jgi:hypothetical protein